MRITQTGSLGPAAIAYFGSALGVWHSLSSAQTVHIEYADLLDKGVVKTYLIEIATDAGGTNIVSSQSVDLGVEQRPS